MTSCLRQLTGTHRNPPRLLSSLITPWPGPLTSSTASSEHHTQVYTDFWMSSHGRHTQRVQNLTPHSSQKSLQCSYLSDVDYCPTCPNQNPEGHSWLLPLSHPHLPSIKKSVRLYSLISFHFHLFLSNLFSPTPSPHPCHLLQSGPHSLIHMRRPLAGSLSPVFLHSNPPHCRQSDWLKNIFNVHVIPWLLRPTENPQNL